MASRPAKNLAATPQSPARGTKLVSSLEERRSLELVIALVGPVASGVSTTGEIIKRLLDEEFGYDSEIISLSKFIKEHSATVGIDLADNVEREERIERYQLAGNTLRSRRSQSFLADCAIDSIYKLRVEKGGVEYPGDGTAVPVPKRLAYIIDSLKNPSELARLREVYGNLLWVITVFAPDSIRLKRLKSIGADEVTALKVMKRDQADDEAHGQQVSKTSHRADYFIRNHSDTRDNLNKSVRRFLNVIFGVGLHTPTFEEEGMMKAAAAALQSACLSRQVGASIYNADGELIGVGCNDVPKFGGGLYEEADGDDDKRCYRWGGQICHNDERKAGLARAIAHSIATGLSEKEGLKSIKADAFELSFTFASQSEAKNLIEFSRSVHAEMEAIVSVAREGKGATLGGTLFTTTYPCHNCARHIVAAGIKRVVFIEPYSKSLALNLHSDSITETDEENFVKFQQYEGFAPRAAMKVFSSAGRERKSGGRFIESNPKVMSPLFPTPLDSYMTTEALVIQKIFGTEGENGEGDSTVG